jgi:hypothetical protein
MGVSRREGQGDAHADRSRDGELGDLFHDDLRFFESPDDSRGFLPFPKFFPEFAMESKAKQGS